MSDVPIYRDPCKLVLLYEESNYNVEHVAIACGVIPGTIYKWLGKFSIEIRGRGAEISKNATGIKRSSESCFLMSNSKKGRYVGENNPFYGKKHSSDSKSRISVVHKGKTISIEQRNRVSIESTGRHHSSSTIYKLRQLRVGSNNPMYGKTGPLCPNWKGGKSFEPYCIKFTKSIKEDVRNSFNRRCFLCNCVEVGIKHAVHHTDYNKGQGCGKMWSLIPLCHSHHTATNHNRHFWFNLLQNYWVFKYDDNMVIWYE